MKPSFKDWLTIVLTLFSLTFGALEGTPLSVATITVTNANNSGASSLHQAIADAAAGDIITFDGDYTIQLVSTLTIDKDLTIDAMGHNVTISGDRNEAGTGDVQVFVINAGVIAALQNLTVIKGYKDYSGGAGWDCGGNTHTTFVTNTWVIRSNVTGFSDWAVGNNVGPMNVVLRATSAYSSGSSSAPVMVGLRAGLEVSMVINRQHRRRKITEELRRLPGPTMCSWPRYSSRVRGRAANGSHLSCGIAWHW